MCVSVHINGASVNIKKIITTQAKKCFFVLLSASSFLPAALHAGNTDLPVEASNFDPAGVVDVVRGGTAVNPVLDINHTVDRTTLNWDSFNIGTDSTVNFNQLNSSSLTLNRIGQQSASQIFGQLNANGRIFLINQNGILFGEGAQVNVNELTASTLNITDQVFEQGILSAIQNQQAAFVPFTDADGNPLPSQAIVIETGATIEANSGGRVMILAPAIENNGIINTPDGQTILAAGNKVYLTGSTDPNLRGILVEVSSDDDQSTVTNLGEIIAERGNITLAALAINQNNRLSATTTTSANGSIRLVARETELDSPFQAPNTIVTTKTGNVTLGKDSVTEILAELDNTDTAIDDQAQFKSTVEIVGEKIHLQENSSIVAKGGEVSLLALEDPSRANPLGTTPIARRDNVVVQMDAGSRIDVSGNSTTLDMSRNNITVELRGNELRDLPIQRDGALRGESVVLDTRLTDSFELGDISGNLANIQRNVAERTSTGGNVTITSEGDVRFLEGAEIDVSGGVIDFREGEIQTTLLQAGSQLVDIHEADANTIYDGVFDVVSRTESAYQEGKDAGTVQIAGRGLIVDGTLTGRAVAGRYQRTEDRRPQGGQLIIGQANGQGIDDFRAPNVNLADSNLSDITGGFAIDINQSFADAGLINFRDELNLSLNFLQTGGFTRAEINSNGTVSLVSGDPLNLAPNSQLDFLGRRIDINRSIASQSGDFNFVSRPVNAFINVGSANAGLNIGDNVSLDVSGNFTNDNPLVSGTDDPVSPVMLDGGSIRLQADQNGTNLSLGDNTQLLARSGAQINSQRQLVTGQGGDISILASGDQVDLNIGQNVSIAAHGSGTGGRLRVAADGIRIEDMTAADWLVGQSSAANNNITRLPDFFFSDLGFSDFDITTNLTDLTIASGASIDLVTSQWFLPATALTSQSGTIAPLINNPSSTLLSVREGALQSGYFNSQSLGFAPQFQRRAGSLNLTVNTGQSQFTRQTFTLSEGAKITADPGSGISISNSTSGWIDISGEIDAPGADLSISLTREDSVRSLDFDDSSVVALTNTANIRLDSIFVDIPDPIGLNTAKVFDGGNLNIVSSGFIAIDDGSYISSVGKNGVFDLQGGVTSSVIQRDQSVQANAGNIILQAGEGIFTEGVMNLSAPDGGYAGSISYEMDNIFRGRIDNSVQGTFPDRALEFVISQSQQGQLANDYKVGDSLDANLIGKAFISTSAIENTGADQLSIRSLEGGAHFEGDSQLSLKRDIVFDVAEFTSTGGNVDLNANYVSFGSSQRSVSTLDTPAAITGTGTFSVDANLIDDQGLAVFQDVGTINLTSSGDIRFRGVGNLVAGELNMVGDLNLDASRIYPTTLTDYTVNVGPGDVAITSSSGTNTTTPLSAGSNLTIQAENITHSGNLFAPIGRINLNANDALTIATGSVTSVSANGESILLGQTLNGLEWLFVNNSLTNARVLYSETQQNSPEKSIALNANNLQVDDGATLDLSGGGDIINWEFVPGPGGSVDGLAAENADNLFAVIPTQNGFAPFDSQEFRGWDLAVGESIYLAGGNGLPAGTYAKLPARYALLPGAFLVESVDGFQNMPLDQQVSFINGTLVAGIESINGTDITQQTTTGFIVRDGSYANELSEFNISTADEIVTGIATANDFQLPRLTRDAGRLAVSANSNIDLDGTLITDAATGGRGALVDITADVLSIVNNKGPATPGVTQLVASNLEQLNAESLLIGGQRSFTSDGTQIDINNNQLTVENDVSLTGPEVILASAGDLTVKTGAALSGTGTSSQQQEIYNLSGDNSLLRVSSAPQVILNRSNVNGTGTSLTIESGVNLLGDGSITLDTTGDLISNANFVDGVDEISFGASTISIGDVTGVAGLILDDAKLAQIEGLDLVLRTNGTIDFYGSANLNQNNIEFSASGLLANQATPADVNITANTIAFGNQTNAAAPASVGTPNGQLSINTNQFSLTGGDFAIEGFSTVDISVSGDVVGQGTTSLNVNADLNLIASRITTDIVSNFAINSTGFVDIGRANVPLVDPTLIRAVGSEFSVNGQSIRFDTGVDMPIGDVRLQASNGDVVLGENANIDVSGTSVDVLGLDTIDLPGGSVDIVADSGDVYLQSGSLIDVRSGGDSANAGTLRMLAQQGDVTSEGQLLADIRGIDADQRGGRIQVDAKTLGQANNPSNQRGFNDLNQILNTGGFTGARDIRVTEGDITIESGEIVKAQAIKITADGSGASDGNITVNGNLLTADSSSGGSIELHAKRDITLNAGSELNSAPTPAANDGKIFLNTATGNLDLKAGSELAAGIDGDVHLRAPRSAAGNDIQISDLNSNVIAKTVILEAVGSVDNVSNLNTSQLNTIRTETNSFMQNAVAIENRLGVASDARFQLTPGVVVRNQGDITISNDLDLSSWRYDDKGGFLTVLATDNININGNLSDGVINGRAVAGESWSYRLTAGASTTAGEYSADIFNTTLGQGNLSLANNKLVRTGTGDIYINAGGNINLGNDGSVVYSLGRESGFELDRRATTPSKLVPTDGGDVVINAGLNINGPGNQNSKTQLINEWYKRQDYQDPVAFGPIILSPAQDAGTWLDFANFRQGVAAFGGGDISVNAGNNIERLSVSAPTFITGDYDTRTITRLGAGDLTVASGGDIQGGVFFIGDGQGSINAGGDIVSGRQTVLGNVTLELDTVFAQMGGDFDVFAKGDIDIESIFNPTLIDEGTNRVIFSSYNNDTASAFTSLNGSISSDPSFADIQQNTSNSIDNSNSIQFTIAPGSLRLAAVSGDVVLKGGELNLFPSTDSSLEIYAGGNVRTDGAATVRMSDEPLNLVPTLNSSTDSTPELGRIINGPQFSEPPLHQGDNSPSWVVAENGDINGGIYFLPEQSRLSAGRDIRDIRFLGQNLNANDITSLQAGRDISQSFANNVISVSGPGRLDVSAGRNVDLGPSVGIETRGNLTNPVLADVGANITVQAGTGNGARYFDFYAAYFDENQPYHDLLLNYLNNIMSPAEVSAFLAQSNVDQWNQVGEDFIPVLMDAFFSELRLAGRTAGNFAQGYRAIDVLFPESQFDREQAFDPDVLSLKLPGEDNQQYFERLAGLSDYQGDINLFFSRIYSLDGGDVNLFTPGGQINAGLASAPANAPDKAPGELGVVAQGTGDIRSYSRGNFQVNQSRVSTLLGGDILLWSSTGDLDAGRGSKSAISAPEPTITITASGDIQVDLSNTVSGSGIRAVVVDPNVVPGDVDLIAPNGIVNAGDAGIATSGNLNIAAQAVVGADNIVVGGVAVGVPSASAGGVSTAGLGGGDVTQAATQDAVESAQEDSQSVSDEPVEEAPQLSFISVEILGFGYDEVEEDDDESEEDDSAEVSLKENEASDSTLG